MAIEKVLRGKVGGEDLRVLKEQQVRIDEFQLQAHQPMHAMKPTAETKAKAISEANAFVTTQLEEARRHIANAGDPKNTESRTWAFEHLGNAIHALQDATSPTHREFQEFHPTRFMGHTLPEATYPGAGTRERAELEAATAWAYDIFSGKVAMPEKFFDDKSGRLLIPESYLVPESVDGRSAAQATSEK